MLNGTTIFAGNLVELTLRRSAEPSSASARKDTEGVGRMLIVLVRQDVKVCVMSVVAFVCHCVDARLMRNVHRGAQQERKVFVTETLIDVPFAPKIVHPIPIALN
ncbi:uncharacterized protein LOC118437438 [Folsomia candida]|uniref:uncharacterized protein LOC118437438 n=1 Tax=Folsomia candida TaxID=158441 RepID=UPI001604E881|nr:uncharacterized protein LOC118437438 [Folsomia candida]